MIICVTIRPADSPHCRRRRRLPPPLHSTPPCPPPNTPHSTCHAPPIILRLHAAATAGAGAAARHAAAAQRAPAQQRGGVPAGARGAGAGGALQHAGHLLPLLRQGTGCWGCRQRLHPAAELANLPFQRRLHCLKWHRTRRHWSHHRRRCHRPAAPPLRTARCGCGTRTAASPSKRTRGMATMCAMRRWWSTTRSERGTHLRAAKYS